MVENFFCVRSPLTSKCSVSRTVTRLEISIVFGFKLSTWKLKESEQNGSFFFFFKKPDLEESVSQSDQFLFMGGDGGSEIQGYS